MKEFFFRNPDSIVHQRDQKEIMKLALDWSNPNPLVSEDLDLFYVLFDIDGKGICTLGDNDNKRKSNFVFKSQQTPLYTIAADLDRFSNCFSDSTSLNLSLSLAS